MKMCLEQHWLRVGAQSMCGSSFLSSSFFLFLYFCFYFYHSDPLTLFKRQILLLLQQKLVSYPVLTIYFSPEAITFNSFKQFFLYLLAYFKITCLYWYFLFCFILFVLFSGFIFLINSVKDVLNAP